MAMNITLGRLQHRDPAVDSRGRSWIGYRKELSTAENFEQNRGVYRMGRRADGESLATFSYQAAVVFVARIDSISRAVDPMTGLVKGTVEGAVLGPETPEHRLWVGTPMRGRAGVTYWLSPGERASAAG